MQTDPRDSYLVTQVMTATSEKLHLMLVEAAIRACEQARQHWRDGDRDKAGERLQRAEDIVGQLMAGLNRDEHPELAARISAVYLFVFRCLVDANLQQEEQKIADALRVLAVERETWRQICEKATAEHEQAVDRLDLRGDRVPPPSTAFSPDGVNDLPTAGFSIEA